MRNLCRNQVRLASREKKMALPQNLWVEKRSTGSAPARQEGTLECAPQKGLVLRAAISGARNDGLQGSRVLLKNRGKLG
jgi:hypothetical protein